MAWGYYIFWTQGHCLKSAGHLGSSAKILTLKLDSKQGGKRDQLKE